MREAFGIPDDHDPVGVITIGHRQTASGRPAHRAPGSAAELGELVHRGRWGG